jgi:hypothetical protein
MKEHLADVLDELVSVSNKQKVDTLIKKFDNKTIKVQQLMQQVKEVMITAQ